MFMKGLAYYLRRLTTMSFNEPFARLRSSVIHRQEKLTYRNHPEAYSLERLFEERATWLAGGDPQGIGSLAPQHCFRLCTASLIALVEYNPCILY